MIYCKTFIFLTINSSNDVIVSLTHSWSPFIEFIYLVINLPSIKHHINEQYLNCDSIKALKKIRLLLNGRNLAALVKALSFLLAF